MSAEIKPSLIRTGVPFVVGPLAGWLANKGLKVDSVFLTMALSSAVGYLYYVVVRFLEVGVSPKWGYILGVAKSPAYSAEPAPSPGPGENVEAVVVPDEPEEEPEPEPEPMLPMEVSTPVKKAPAKKAPTKRAPAKTQQVRSVPLSEVRRVAKKAAPPPRKRTK